jgi:hypothetical protein
VARDGPWRTDIAIGTSILLHRKTPIELVIAANPLTGFKYGDLFEVMANSSENDIGF